MEGFDRLTGAAASGSRLYRVPLVQRVLPHSALPLAEALRKSPIHYSNLRSDSPTGRHSPTQRLSPQDVRRREHRCCRAPASLVAGL
jgi:hypothetical protein